MISDDCPQTTGTVPPTARGRKTVAVIQFEILSGHPYEYTQEDVLFMTYAAQNGIKASDDARLRREFFSTPKPCLRSSPLPKKYGWGFHFDRNGKVALYGAETSEYKRMSANKG